MKKITGALFLGTLFIQISFGQNVGIGTTVPKAKLDIKGDLILESKNLIIPDGTIYQLDVNSEKFNHYKLTGPTNNFQIAGIAAAEHDRTVALYNRTGFSLEIYNDHATPLPEDRILTGTGGTFAVFNGGNVVLKYDTLIAKWEIISSHYNSLDNFENAWAENGNNINNTNTGSVGIGTTTPTAKLTVNGNIALQSDTVRISCDIMPPPYIVIDNIAKNKSVIHIIAEGCGAFYFSPGVIGLTGGADGKVVSLVSHINNMQILNMQGATAIPSMADSLNMIELYEPNSNGAINQPTSYTLNNGGSITLIYDVTRHRWKPLSMYGDVQTEIVGWNKGVNPNNIYNPNTGNVGIGTSSPTAKLEVNGTFKVVDGNQGAGKLLTSDATGLASWQPPQPAWKVNGNAGTGSANFIGTTDNQPLRFKINGNNAGIISVVNDNTAFGNFTLSSITSANNNSAFGSHALQTNTQGSENTAIGSNALYANTEGYSNTAVGVGSLAANTSGYKNTAVGVGAMQNNTTGQENIGVGFLALQNNTTGTYNSAFGPFALQSNTVGAFNTASGCQALYLNTTGDLNSAFGWGALFHNTAGHNNSAFGKDGLYNNITGGKNSALGVGALSFNISGSFNSAIGSYALQGNISGNYNTVIGFAASSMNQTGSWNTCVGDYTNTSFNYLNGAMALGSSAISNADNKIVIGANTPGIEIGGWANWTTFSDGRFKDNIREDIPGLNFIKELRPVTYTIDINKLQHYITAQMPDSIALHYYPTVEVIKKADEEIRTGFIAQEVEAAALKIGYKFDGVNVPKNSTDNYSIAYGQFVVPLVKAVQEQQAMIETLQKQINELKALVVQVVKK